MFAKMIKLVFISSVVFIIACGSVPETHYYTIELSKLSEQTQHVGSLLHVQPFDASTVLKYDKLMYKTSAYEIKYDAYRRWAAAPSTLLSEKAVEYFCQSKLFDHVVTDTPSMQDGFSLFGYVSHFEESLEKGNRVALVEINFDVFDISNRDLLLHKSIRKVESIQSETVEGIMLAMSEAAQAVFDELAEELVSLEK